jgi:hypothetical protein
MLNVICVKHGTKYGPEYVNKLYNMVQRHLTIPHNFICFTEDSKKIDANVIIKPLPDRPEITGWWWKTYIFQMGHFDTKDTNLFFDLDMVIISNIDKFITYEPECFVGLEDVGRVFNRPQKLGSAVLRWKGNRHSNIWDPIDLNPNITKRYKGGDQDWIWECCKREIKFFPKTWIMSYKWEIRNQNELIRRQDKWIFKESREPEIDKNTAVLAFHGTPDLEDVEDKIIINNWR